MKRKLSSQIPFGNGRVLASDEASDPPTIEFAAEPNAPDGPGWFNVRIAPDTAEGAGLEGNLRVRLRHAGDLSGGGLPGQVTPVCRSSEQDWARIRHGLAEIEPDGQTTGVWTLRAPTKWSEMALCFPYGRHELRSLLQKSGGYWTQDAIGLGCTGHPIQRLSNDYGRPGAKRPGLYLVAREQACDMPASWVLEGALQEWSRLNCKSATIWMLPFAHPDAAAGGRRGPLRLTQEMPEAIAMESDLRRWRERCAPALVLELRARGACDIDGIAAHLPANDSPPDLLKETEKWANVIGDALAPDYPAEPFKRPLPHRQTPSLAVTTALRLGTPALSLAVPHCEIRKQTLTRKSYRQIGKLLAATLLKRLK